MKISRTNRARADEACAALHHFADITNDDCDDDKFSRCLQNLMVYLLADLRHLCDGEDWDFAALDKRGYHTYLDDRASFPVED